MQYPWFSGPVALVLIALLGGCSTKGAVADGGGAAGADGADAGGMGGADSDDSGGTAAADIGPGGEGPICDGQPGVRLAVRIAGGGPIAPGTAMLADNGWQFLLVEGSCVAWILKSNNEPLRTITLSREREQRLADSLKVSQWSRIQVMPFGGCLDAPGISYRFGQSRIAGAVCGLRPDDPLNEINEAFRTELTELSAAASTLSGDVRYLIIADSGFRGGDNRAPVPWPLDLPIAPLALANGDRYSPGDSRLATGTDASRLRAIRTTALNGSAGNGTVFDYTPVKAADGSLYQLYVRDAVPLESPNGLLPVEVF